MSAQTSPELRDIEPPVRAPMPIWRRILFRFGLVLTAIMGLFNTLNGAMTLMEPDQAAASPAIGGLLFAIGLPTLLLVGLAWIPIQWALITVIGLRALEVLTMWIPMGEGDWYSAPDNRPFYLGLVVVSTAVCALMALGLRRGRG